MSLLCRELLRCRHTLLRLALGLLQRSEREAAESHGGEEPPQQQGHGLAVQHGQRVAAATVCAQQNLKQPVHSSRVAARLLIQDRRKHLAGAIVRALAVLVLLRQLVVQALHRQQQCMVGQEREESVHELECRLDFILLESNERHLHERGNVV